LYSGGWSPNWVHSARRPLTGLLYLPRVIVRMENLVEWMAGETEVLGENLPHCPPQIPLDQTRDWTRAAAMGSQRLTASVMARPHQAVSHRHFTATAWFRALNNLRRICGEESSTGAGFLRVLRFPLPTASHSLIILSSSLYTLYTDTAEKKCKEKRASFTDLALKSYDEFWLLYVIVGFDACVSSSR
jgi:hypothetical protein